MSEHTPGPWEVRVGEGQCFHEGNRVAIVKIEGEENNEYTVAEVWPTEGDADIAEARLIAAAPDLLEAARRCTDDLLMWRGDEPAETLQQYLAEAHAELSAAIAKATGQEE